MPYLDPADGTVVAFEGLDRLTEARVTHGEHEQILRDAFALACLQALLQSSHRQGVPAEPVVRHAQGSPVPRDRHGLPDSLRFWKTRIEETDPDQTFSVGLLYGPSGCGKSSLVKAGLLPRLAEHVQVVYVEATPAETEARLVKGLRKRCPEAPVHEGLVPALAGLRRGTGLPAGKKVLIVLDQFEQWLHAKRSEQHIELVQALRQCDSEHVQCLALVRDDFGMAATRFMRDLEVRIVEGHNFATVDLRPWPRS